ncbi:ribosome rescue protein RqcH [Vulcanisaeta sp. JCM 14467]|uniref:ribosome rescue protein RqcH n=1 Tax=Vulcanisaeta sp. JCM 14467 TaxID=1295370 RepID=UPI0006D1F4DE|nr:ribosome rescue protein RqcH [Vulcanisaeta sp. JCM 14467]
MPSQKKSLNVLDLLAIVMELSDLRDSVIDKVYTMGNSLLIRLRKGSEKYFVIANSHRFGLTSYVLEHGAEGVTSLRRLVEGLRLRDLELLNFDRIVKLTLDTGYLIIELLEPWNMIYVDGDGRIKWVLRTYRGKDRVVNVGLEYNPPPQNFVKPVDNREVIIKALQGYDTVGRAIARGLGLGGEVANEVCARALINCDSPVNSINIDGVLSVITSMINKISRGDLEPTIYYSGGSPITVTPIMYQSIKYDDVKHFGRFNEAVDEYFHEVEIGEESEKRLATISSEIARLERSVDELMMSIEGFRKGSEELRVKAETVLNWKYVIEELLNVLRNYWSSYKDEFQELVRGMEYQGIRVKGFEPRSKAVVLEIGGVTVSIPLNADVGDLINGLFNRAKELERKAKTAEESLNQLRARIEELRAEGEKIAESVRESSIRVVYGAREWFERFRWFITSSGRLVIAGRDATQNEVIVRHYLRPWDIFVHADILGGAAVVIRLADSGDTVSDRDIQEAAQYAVSYSRAWVMGLSVLDAFYVRGEQVTKKAPSGEYLGKGSFMIYGSRGWVRNAELGLGIGVRIDNMGVSSIIRIITAPPSAIGSLTNYYITLRPGTRDRVNVSKEVYDTFKAKIPGFAKVINLSHIVDAVPGPSTIEGFYEGNPMPWDKLRSLAK